MAVEIPVYVDIEKALNDAASRVPAASKPLEQKMADIGMKMGESLSDGLKSLDIQVDRVSKRVSTAISNMQRVVEKGPGTGGVDDMNEKMSSYSNTIRLAAQQMLKLGESMGQVKADGVNIRGVTQQLAVLSEQWKSMKLSSKFDEDGKLRVRAQQIIDKMSRLVARATKFGDALAGDSRVAAEAQQEHIKALTMTGTTLDQLNTRLAAWKQELMSAEQGSDAFRTVSQEVQSLIEQIQNLNNATKIFGSANGSINQVSTAMQSLNQQYAALSEVDRRGDAGKKLIAQYKELARYMDKGVVDLNKMYQMEQRLEEYSMTRSRTKQYEEAVLNSTANTMHRLSEKARILNERLAKAKFGTKEYDDLKVKLGQVNREMQNVQGTMTGLNGTISKQSGLLRSLMSYASMYVSVFGLIRFAKQIRDVTGELEYQRVALGHLIQDEEYGARMFEQIKQNALLSPFQIKDLVTYTKQLAAYRIEQENLIDTTKRLADISAGLGVDMNRLILAYGQVRAASVLRGQELRQFTEAGIPLVELLADKMGELHNTTYRTADVFKLISERAVPFSAISEIFEELTDKGGMFYEMQKEQADTLKGRWEKLKDAFTIGLQAAGETKTFLWQNGLLLNTLTLLAKNIRFLPKLIEAVGAAWLAYTLATIKSTRAIKAARIEQVQLTAEEAAEIATKGLSAKATDALTRARIREKAATTLVTRAWWKLNAAMIANPIGAAIAGVSAIISLFVFWRKKTDEVADSYKDLTDAIENVSQSEKTYEKMRKLIDSYGRLASKTERTAKENVQLAQTLSSLREAFPDVALTVDETNESLGKTVTLLKDLNEGKKLEGIQNAFRAREIAQDNASELSAEISRLNREQDQAWAEYKAKKDAGDTRGADKARAAYDKLGEKIDEVNKKYLQNLKYIQALDKYLNPDSGSGLAVWQKTMMRMKDFTVDGKTFNLIGEGDIEGYESLYKGLKEIDKIYKDSKQSADEMKEALSAVEHEYREDAEEEIRIEEARRDAAKAILDTFGYKSENEKKGKKESLQILKEELKNVQDIYKRYNELMKYMSNEEAQKKIREIYGGVTEIDFLSPETYKRRLAMLLAELRVLQGRIRAGAVKLSGQMFNDLKETIKKNEGFVETAYQLPGESGYTIGYGFYKQLSDGTKVVKGMTMSLEEADAELDRQIAARSQKLNSYLETYGKGMELTTRQYNVLMDLMFQGPAVLRRVLKEADGNTEKLAVLLEDAASKSLESKDQKIIDAVKKRDMRRAQAFRDAGLANEDDAKDLQETIFSVEKLVQDVDWDELEKALEQKLKKITEDLKNSETARNFYRNVLDVIGDEDLAANMTVSIYGGIGDDFKERIQKQLYRALTELQPNLIGGDLMTQLLGDITVFDIDDILANLDKLPEKVKEVFKEAINEVQKYDSDLMKNFADLIAKYGDTAQKIATVEAKAQNEIRKVKDALEKSLSDESLSPEQKKSLEKKAEEIIKAINAGMELDKFKLSDNYVAFFAEINMLTADQAANIRGELRNAYLKAFHDSAISADELRRNLRSIDEQFRKLSESTSLFGAYLSGGFDGANKKLQDYADTVGVIAEKMKSGKSITDAEQGFASKMLKLFGNDGVKNAKSFEALIQAFSSEGGIEAAGEAFGKMGEGMSAAAANGPGALAIVDAIIKAVHGAISGIQQVIDQLNELRSEENQIGDWFKYVSDFDKYAFSGWEKLKSGDAIGATADAIGSIISIFNNVQRDKLEKINKDIENQSKLLDELDYSYSRLENAIAKSFGSEHIYNYNKQLEILEAKAEAYRKQAELERGKGKSADEEIAKGYEKSARETKDQISDILTQLSEFFSGTDLTSAAEDFASAWIEAYKEFGSTTDAMSEKFNEMIESMINRSLAAKIMQEMLSPIFDEIDTLSKDGLLSTEEISTIAALAQERIPLINDAMTNLMSSLAAAGLDVRTTTAGFKGISRNIANASEESILGLAAAVNTQNFYMSYMPTINENVAMILSVMTGGTSGTRRNAQAANGENLEVMPTIQQMVYDHLPVMDQNIAEMLRLFRSVITTKTSTTNTNYIAVK